MYACKYFSSVHNNFVNTKRTTQSNKRFLKHNRNCYITDYKFVSPYRTTFLYTSTAT